MGTQQLSVSRNTRYNLIGSGIPIALSLLTVPLYLNLIGTERYGVLAIAWLLLGYFGLFDLGLGRATSYRIAARGGGSAQERADTFWSALGINLLFALIGGALFWAASVFFFTRFFKVDAAIHSEIIAAVPLLAVAVPIAILNGVLTGALSGRERFLELNVITATSTAMFQIFPLFLAWKVSPNLSVVLAGAVAARMVALILLFSRCHVHLCVGTRIRVTRAEVMALLKYGGWVSVSSVITPLLFMTDRFAIGAVLGATAVATYTVPYQLATRVQILPAALTSALFPRLSASGLEQQAAISAQAEQVLMSLLLLPFAAAIFLLEPFLTIWVGDTLGEAAGMVGRVVLLGMWANAFALIAFTLVQSAGRPSWIVYVMLAQIVPYAFVLYYGMIYLGLVGAALAHLVRSALDFVLLSAAARRAVRAQGHTAHKPGKVNWGWHAMCFLYLGTCLLAASYWTTISDWRWWASCISLTSVGLVMALVIMPETIRVSLRQFARKLGFT